jgi:hypothetical protein
MSRCGSRRSNAIATPATSALLACSDVAVTPPENSTCSPALRAGSATRSSAAWSSSVSWSTGTLNCRSENATVLSGETVAGVSGCLEFSACGTFRAARTVGAMSLR